MISAKLDLKKFWGDAVLAYTYLKNRSLSSPRNYQIPEVMWTGNEININHIRAFGSKAYYKIEDHNRGKFEPKGEARLFVGYPNGTNREGTKGYGI